ncbi:unnamed protein product [Leptosia nina]|uniref:Ribosomal protein S14 n=1 Tax=Leptosia nina TaxID=320188 RepID=A0AAV1JH64_9NEOP
MRKRYTKSICVDNEVSRGPNRIRASSSVFALPLHKCRGDLHCYRLGFTHSELARERKDRLAGATLEPPWLLLSN